MERNFSIASTAEIVAGGHKYDLHNDFDAVGLQHLFEKNELSLVWRSGDAMARVRFTSLQILRLKGFDNEMPRKEDRRLSFMGYLRPDDDSMDAFLPEELSGSDFDMIFCFEGGQVVRVRAAVASFESIAVANRAQGDWFSE